METELKNCEIVKELDVIWGNRGTYADKTKTICDDIYLLLNRMLSKHHNNDGASNSEPSDQIKDCFIKLFKSENEEIFEDIFNIIFKAIENIRSKNLQSCDSMQNGMDIIIKEKVRFFEETTGLFSNVDEAFSTAYNEKSVDKNYNYENLEYFDELISDIQKAFEKIKIIILHHGFLSIMNCGYVYSEFQYLNIKSKDNSPSLHVDFQDLCNTLKKSNNNDYDDLFDESYETHLLLFFECMFLLIEYVSNIHVNTEIPSIDQMKSYLSEWIEYIKIAVDRLKYKDDIDMITVYINARKAYQLITNSLDLGEM